MATEGIAAALSLKEDELKALDRAQESVSQMANAAESLAGSFGKIKDSFGDIAKSSKGINLSASFDSSGALKNIKLISDAVAKANEFGVDNTQRSSSKKTKIVKDEAQKQIEIYERAMAKEVKYRQKKERMYTGLFSAGDSKDASDLNARLDAALAGNPKLLPQMKEQLRLLKEINSETSKMRKNPYIDAGKVEQAKAKIDELNSKIRESERRLKSTGKSASNLKGVIGNAFSIVSVTNFLRNLVAIRGEFEIQERSLAVIIKDAYYAKSMFKEIEQIAVRSPFSVMEIVKQTKQLAAYRIEADKLIDTTKMLGDISAGVGVDMNRLILAYGQVKAATFLKGQELRQFSEAGVNMLGGLAERFSEIYQRAVSTGEVLQMVSKRMVKFEDVDAVLRSQVEAGGTFYRMQEIQAETLQGAITNLKDRIQIAFNEMGTSYDSMMKTVVKGLEWVISKWDVLNNILVGGVVFKILTVLGGKVSRLINTVSEGIRIVNTYRRAANIAIATTTSGLNITTKLLTRIAALGKGLRAAFGLTNILSLIASLVAMMLNIVRQARELQRSIERISKNIKETESTLESRYNKLMDVASDVTASEITRLRALDDLKSEYGNILSLQNVELSNIEEINKAREEQIALIHEYAVAQGREQAMVELVGRLNKTSEDRQKQMWGENGQGLESFIEQYKSEVRGLELIDEDMADSARRMIEQRIIDGSIETAEDANKELLRYILKMADATEEQIEQVMSSLGAGSYVNITRAFDLVESEVKKVTELFKKNEVDILPVTTIKYQELMDGFKEVSEVFKKENKEMFNQDLPGYKVMLRGELLSYYDEVKKAIQSGEFRGRQLGEISNEAKKGLQKALDAAFSGVSAETDVQLWVDEIMSAVNKEFPNLRHKLGIGEMAFGESDSIEKYADKLAANIDKIYSIRSMLFPVDGSRPTEGELLQELAEYGGDAASAFTEARNEVIKLESEEAKLARAAASPNATIEDFAKLFEKQIELEEAVTKKEEKFIAARNAAIDELNKEEDAQKQLLELLGQGIDSAKDKRLSKKALQERVANLELYANKVIGLRDSFDSLSEAEKELLEQQIIDLSLDVGIEPPSDYELRTVEQWFIDNILNNKIINAATKFDMKLKLAEQTKKDISETSKGFVDLAKEIINVGKEWDDMGTDVQDATKKVLESQSDDFNKLSIVKLLGIDIELPEVFTPEQIRAWLYKYRDMLVFEGQKIITDKDMINLELMIARWLESQSKNQNNGDKGGDRKTALKEFINELKKAKKELGDLDDAGDELLNKKLNSMAKKAGLVKGKNTIDFKNMSQEDLNSWLDKLANMLDKDDMIDIRLSWSKEELSERIKEISREASVLWEKYNTAKKFEDWGINLQGYNTKEIYQQILGKEDELRRINTDQSIKEAENLSKKRLQIFMGQEEEAAKLIYEAEKKSASKVEQIYQKLYEDIANMRAGQKSEANPEGIDSKTVDKGVAAATTKAMKEAAKAQWDAFKSTEMYAMAFGDLENISKPVLEGLLSQLKAFKRNMQLNPSDMRSVERAIKNLEDQKNRLSNGKFMSSFIEAFRAAGDSIDILENKLPVLEEKMIDADKKVQYYQNMRDQAAAEVETNPNDAVARAILVKREKDLADATQEASEATNEYSEAQKKANSLMSNAKKKVDAVSSAYNSVGSAISETISLAQNIAEAFGLATDPEIQAAIEGFEKGFQLVGAAISVVSAALTVAKIIGDQLMATLWPLLVIGAALGAIMAIISANDAQREKVIEAHKRAVERLQKAYEDLEETFERVLSLKDASNTYNTMMANLKRQYIELSEAIAANNNSKQTDKVKEETEDLMEQLEEVKDKMKEAQEQKMELLGANNNYQDIASDWSSSWLDAFKDTGDGLGALRGDFDDFYDDIVSGQIQSLIMGPALKKLEEMVKATLSDWIVTDEEAAALQNYRDTVLAGINEESKLLAKKLGVKAGTDEGDTLQKGIEAVSEQTAQALESILNSTRFYVADNNRALLNIEQVIVGEGENTILANLHAQTNYLRALSTIADAVYYSGEHSKGAGGIKVFVD